MSRFLAVHYALGITIEHILYMSGLTAGPLQESSIVSNVFPVRVFACKNCLLRRQDLLPTVITERGEFLSQRNVFRMEANQDFFQRRRQFRQFGFHRPPGIALEGVRERVVDRGRRGGGIGELKFQRGYAALISGVSAFVGHVFVSVGGGLVKGGLLLG